MLYEHCSPRMIKRQPFNRAWFVQSVFIKEQSLWNSQYQCGRGFLTAASSQPLNTTHATVPYSEYSAFSEVDGDAVSSELVLAKNLCILSEF